MSQTVKILFIVISLLLPIVSYAESDSIEPAKTPPPVSNQNHLTALRYHSLPQNLQTAPGKINLSDDCINAQGQLTTTGLGKEVTVCPPGYLANEEDVQKTQLLGVGSARYYLRCCKAYVTYI
jgi:hypothetical protein